MYLQIFKENEFVWAQPRVHVEQLVDIPVESLMLEDKGSVGSASSNRAMMMNLSNLYHSGNGNGNRIALETRHHESDDDLPITSSPKVNFILRCCVLVWELP